jgi:hypothetical protein
VHEAQKKDNDCTKEKENMGWQRQDASVVNKDEYLPYGEQPLGLKASRLHAHD